MIDCNSRTYRCLVLVWLAGLMTGTCLADQSLEQAANDPTASIMALQIDNNYSASYHGLDDTGNKMEMRVALPYKTGSLSHIARATLPIVTDSPKGGSGVGDLFRL